MGSSRLLAAAALLLCIACTRANDRYCLDHADCASGRCDLDSRSCLGTDGPADAMVDAMPCSSDLMCTGANAPFCDDDGLCRGCTPAGGFAEECAEVDPNRPECASDGRCVACATSASCTEMTAPVCDAVVNECRRCGNDNECTDATLSLCAPDGACVECLQHDDCESEVCSPQTRTCADPGHVVYVAEAGSDQPTCGATDQPCKTIKHATTRLIAPKAIMRLRAGTYTEDVTVSGKTFLLVGSGATLRGNTSGKPVLAVTAASTVYVQDLVVRGGAGAGAHGIDCDGVGTALTLDNVQVRFNEGHGIEVDKCALTVLGGLIENNMQLGISTVGGGSVTLSRAKVTRNGGGGVLVQATGFDITNSMLVLNGTKDVSSVGGVQISNLAAVSPQRFAFNTVADNNASSAAYAYGVDCRLDVATIATSTFVNNIVWGGTGPAKAYDGNCPWKHSNLQGWPDDANLNVPPGFVGSGSYHLDPSGNELLGQGVAVDGIDVDFDGEVRDAVPDIGADEVVGQ